MKINKKILQMLSSPMLEMMVTMVIQRSLMKLGESKKTILQKLFDLIQELSFVQQSSQTAKQLPIAKKKGHYDLVYWCGR